MNYPISLLQTVTAYEINYECVLVRRTKITSLVTDCKRDEKRYFQLHIFFSCGDVEKQKGF